MNKIKIGVLMGGRSSEHDISILSGQQIIKNLDKNKYEVYKVLIPKEEKWNINSIIEKNLDIVFIALHGKFGEDGTIQGMMETAGIKYTGSGVLASAIGMDKEYFRIIMKSQNLPIPRYVVFNKSYKSIDIRKIIGKAPYFIKPSNGGSSVGVSIVKHIDDLEKAVTACLKYDNKVLVDEYIKGTEVTCAVIGNENPYALPVIEIKPLKNDFFDYDSKYLESGAEEIVPAKLSKSISNKIQDLAIQVYKTVGCRGFARVDFILKDNKDPIILEINTIPGLTEMSLLPKAAKAAHITYSELLDIIIDNAIK